MKIKTMLNVEGMSCEHCVKAVKTALEAVSGVKKAIVNLKAKNAEVHHDDSVHKDALQAAVSEAGFSVS